jgi:hypothetical protein
MIAERELEEKGRLLGPGIALDRQLCQLRRNRFADADQHIVMILAKQPAHILRNQVILEPETLTNYLFDRGGVVS